MFDLSRVMVIVKGIMGWQGSLNSCDACYLMDNWENLPQEVKDLLENMDDYDIQKESE